MPRNISSDLLRSIILLTIILSILYVAPCPALTYDFRDTIAEVVDGDSFKGSSGKEYRIADVSAPEWNQPGGTASTNNMKSMILNKNVYIDIDGTMTYDRYVCVVYIDYDSSSYLNVNKAQWSGGYAQVDDHPNAWNPYDWTLYVEKPSTPQDNLTLIFALIALIGVAVYFVSTKLRSRPVSSIRVLEVKSYQKAQRGVVNHLQAKLKYFGTVEGMIIKAIAVDGMHELSRIKEQVKLPEEEFMRAFYTLLRLSELEGGVKGTFKVKSETCRRWIEYYRLNDKPN